MPFILALLPALQLIVVLWTIGEEGHDRWPFVGLWSRTKIVFAFVFVAVGIAICLAVAAEGANIIVNGR
jgi:hypothetical protein